MDDKNSLNEEMRGEFPFKIRNLTISGKTLRTLGNNIFQVRYFIILALSCFEEN